MISLASWKILQSFTVLDPNRFSKLPLCQNKKARETKHTWLSVRAGKLSCSLHTQAIKQGGTKPGSVGKAAVVPQPDTEADAPSCSPLLKHISSFAVSAFHLWLLWTIPPWGGPARTGQAQLCSDAYLNWLGNYALNPQPHQHFQAGRKQHCHHEKWCYPLLFYLPYSLPQVLDELNWGICSPQNVFSTNKWLSLHYNSAALQNPLLLSFNLKCNLKSPWISYFS